jgi:hypothetical protein
MTTIYTHDDIIMIKNNGNYNMSIPIVVFNLIKQLDKLIIPPLQETTTTSDYKHKPKSNQNRVSSNPIIRASSSSGDNWIAIKKVKPTKMEVKTGVEKDINDIRISLNKISTKNYESQKETILLFISKMFDEETPEEAEKHLQPIAQFIFDIASANKFYSELYADLYQSLTMKYTVFESILHDFVSTYKDLIQKNVYVSPDINYDAFCDYTKKNENRRATTSFLVMLMNRCVIPTHTIVEIIIHFQELFIQYIDEENRTNEVDELTEVLFLFITLGKEKLQKFPEWGNIIYPNLVNATLLKSKNHKSLSSRSVFKLQDALKKIDEN